MKIAFSLLYNTDNRFYPKEKDMTKNRQGFTLLVTGSHLSTPVALVESALVSLPLLMFHVARSWGRGFALTSVLPLTLFTAALVFNGVYGGGFRLYGFLALFVAGVIFFTPHLPGLGRQAGRIQKRDAGTTGG